MQAADLIKCAHESFYLSINIFYFASIKDDEILTL
jgi:hypothetical protein